MSSMKLARTLGLSLVFLASVAKAADFDVSPTRLDLSAKARTGHLVVRNPGSAPLRLQVSAMGWQQSPEGAVVLEATTEVSFFPSLFELAPGQSKNIRIGVSGPEATNEKTFRVLIDELPERSTVTGGVQVVTRLSVPVFFGKSGLQAKPEVVSTELKQGGGVVTFAVKNAGAAHFMATKAVVVGEDGEGKRVLSGEAAGWYVLAGGERRFQVAVKGEGGSGRVAKVVVRVETDAGPVTAQVRLP